MVGAGIVGVACAIRLRQDGHDVSLVDRLGPGEATSHGNGGVLASASVVPVTVPGLRRKAVRMALDPSSPLFLRWRHLPRMAPWLLEYLKHCSPEHTRRISQGLALLLAGSLEEHQSLARGSGAAAYIRPSDYVFAYRDRAAFQADAFAWGLRRDAGFAWTEIEGDELRDYDPLVAHGHGFAAILGDHGMIADPGRYVAALAEHLSRLGGRILREEVVGLALEGERVCGLRLASGMLPADDVVIAAGVWSKRLAAELGVRLPLESERGYHIEFDEPTRTLRSPTMFAAQKFVGTPMAGRLRCAGLVEFAGLDAPPSEAPYRLLERRARESFPADLTHGEMRRWMGHRPATTDSLPVIGAPRRYPNVVFACGHHHVGLTGGPRTGRMVADIVAGRRSNVDFAPYSAERFPR